jgi:hypothetical protein
LFELLVVLIEHYRLLGMLSSGGAFRRMTYRRGIILRLTGDFGKMLREEVAIYGSVVLLF